MSLESIDKGFSKIYKHYESLSQKSLIDKTMRKQVYKHINHFIKPKSSILELNSGSGIDAVYFAQNGHFVTATDIAVGSKTYINTKIKDLKLANLSFKTCTFNNLQKLEPNKYNYVFSNFGGLNCTDKLEKVLVPLHNFVEKDSMVTFVIMGKYYPWDWIYVLKGKFKRAFIRFKKNGTYANIEGEAIKTYYHSPKHIKHLMKPYFQFVASENLGLFYPSVNHTAITKHSRVVRFLIALDTAIKKLKIMPLGIGDYYIITFKKKKKTS